MAALAKSLPRDTHAPLRCRPAQIFTEPMIPDIGVNMFRALPPQARCLDIVATVSRSPWLLLWVVSHRGIHRIMRARSVV